MAKIKLLDAAKFYKGIPQQIKALEALDKLLTNEQRQVFQDIWRQPPATIAAKPKPEDVYLYCFWTGKYEGDLKIFSLNLMNGDTVVDKMACCSGQGYAQDVVWPTDDWSGSMRPLPEGAYNIGAIDDLGYDPDNLDGFGRYVVALEPWAAIKRSLLRAHADWNASTSKGSAGCLCPFARANMLRFIGWLRMAAAPKFLIMDHGLGFLAQNGIKIPKKSIAPSTAPTGGVDEQAVDLEQELLSMLEGGTSSIIAIAVGCAEGTRTPDGGFTAAYHGHTDPGNGARNQGSFSYQGQATNPPNADWKQIEKFKAVLLPRFLKEFGIAPIGRTELKALWAIACDVFTQSEVACLGKDGFLDRIAAFTFEFSIPEINTVRYESYFDPKTSKLDAPGFGNDPARLRADQERRTKAVLEIIN
jgi:hypothetical protein